MFHYDAYNLNKKQANLVIFLHGYNGSIADHRYAVDWLNEKLDNAYIIVPQAPEICDKNPQKYQWFGMIKYDPEKKRNQPETSSQDIFKIYNAAGRDIDAQAHNINAFIDEMQANLHIKDSRTFLIGFSQGAMLTIYTALTRKKTLGGAFALSGLVAGTELLQKQILSRPDIYLFHGENDIKVQYKTLPDTMKWLTDHQINTAVRTYAGLDHRMVEDEIETIAQKINAVS